MTQQHERTVHKETTPDHALCKTSTMGAGGLYGVGLTPPRPAALEAALHTGTPASCPLPWQCLQGADFAAGNAVSLEDSEF